MRCPSSKVRWIGPAPPRLRSTRRKGTTHVTLRKTRSIPGTKARDDSLVRRREGGTRRSEPSDRRRSEGGMDTGVGLGSSSLLLQQADPPSSRSWTLEGDALSIGRDPSSDIFVDDPECSRHHARLVRRGPSWHVVDSGSTNGTFVNGMRHEEHALSPGDRIRVGHTELVLTQPGVHATDPQASVVRYEVGHQ